VRHQLGGFVALSTPLTPRPGVAPLDLSGTSLLQLLRFTLSGVPVGLGSLADRFAAGSVDACVGRIASDTPAKPSVASEPP
jgi:hypothetical protein